MFCSTTTSLGPPTRIRCSTLSRLIRTRRRLVSRAAASMTAMRGWRERPPSARVDAMRRRTHTKIAINASTIMTAMKKPIPRAQPGSIWKVSTSQLVMPNGLFPRELHVRLPAALCSMPGMTQPSVIPPLRRASCKATWRPAQLARILSLTFLFIRFARFPQRGNAKESSRWGKKCRPMAAACVLQWGWSAIRRGKPPSRRQDAYRMVNR